MRVSESRFHRGKRHGFTLVELMIVLFVMGIVASSVIPRLNLSGYRSDAAAQQVRSVFQTAERTSLTRQYDVIVSVDTIKGGLRIAEDKNNNGIIESSEVKFWRPEGEGNHFGTPPIGISGATVSSAVIGTSIRTVDGFPSLTFHRDGSASTDAQVYMSSTYKGRVEWRSITVTRSTSRTELYKLAGTGASAKWITVAQ